MSNSFNPLAFKKRRDIASLQGGKCQGFTLIELLVVIAVGLLLLSVLFSLLLTSFRLFDKGVSKIHVVEQAWRAMERIKRDVRESTLNFNCESERKLTIRKFLTDNNDSIIYDSKSKGFPKESDPIIYSFSNRILKRNGMIIGEDFSDVRFLLKKDDNQWLPIINVHVAVEFRGHLVELECHIIPRFWAAYEKSRYWISNMRGQPLKRPIVKLGQD